MPSIETYELLLAAAAAAEDKKAEDIRILALDPAESGLTDYFLICNGTNERQNVAITDEIELRLKRDFNTYPNSVEGRRQGEWILMDYVDFIVHVFSAEKRAYYGLERLRKSATTISIAELNAELKARVTATRAKAPKKAAAKKPPHQKHPQRKQPQRKQRQRKLQPGPLQRRPHPRKPQRKSKAVRTLRTQTSRIRQENEGRRVSSPPFVFLCRLARTRGAGRPAARGLRC